MKVLILGGTGMLGYPAALEFLRNGDQVEATARSAATPSQEFNLNVNLHLLDVFTAPEEQLVSLLTGVDVLVYALGPDDREAPVAPARDFFQHYLVEQCERILRIARRSAVKRAVVLGSYFVTFDQLHPDWRLAEHHPYIQARVEQARRAVSAGQGWAWKGHHHMDVMVLELPYIFGVTPGRTPFWKDVLFERVRKMPVVMYPRGGSVVMTTRQVGEAVYGAARYGRHGQSYPVGDVNMNWNELVGIIRSELGLSTRVVNVPQFLTQQSLNKEKAALTRQGRESGLNLDFLAGDIMYREFYYDPERSRKALHISSGGVEQAIRETVRASYPEVFAR